MKMNRILGLDIGDNYIGIAVSDPLGMTAQPYRTYLRKTRDEDIEFFNDVVGQFNVETLVCGLPLNMDGTESSQTRKTVNFANFLKKRLPIKNLIFVNEQLTSEAAGEILDTGGIKDRKKRKSKIDTIAAQLILQEYMDNQEKYSE